MIKAKANESEEQGTSWGTQYWWRYTKCMENREAKIHIDISASKPCLLRAFC